VGLNPEGASVVKLTKTVRNGVAGALIAAMPVSTTVAAVRPSAAVPTAGSTAVTAQGVEEGVAAFPWLPIGIVIATLVLAIVVATKKGGNGSGSLSRG
jgi:hypothetical protein